MRLAFRIRLRASRSFLLTPGPVAPASRPAAMVPSSISSRQSLQRADQLAPINAIFTPSSEAIAHARAVMEACSASGSDMPALNGHAIEPAMVRAAERALAIAARRHHAVIQSDAA